MATKKIILAALVLPLLLPSLSPATSVRYSTVGSITGASFITYKDVTNKFVHSMPAVMEPFGMLKIHCKDSSCLASGATLSVTISQSLPGSGAVDTSPVFFGTFTKSADGAWTLVWNGAVTIKEGGFATTYTPITSDITCGEAHEHEDEAGVSRAVRHGHGDGDSDLERQEEGSVLRGVSAKRNCSVKLLVDITQKRDPVPEPSAKFLLELGALGLIGFVTASRKKIVSS